MYEISYHLFKEINIERFARFDFYDIDKQNDFQLYCEKQMIVRYNGKYYMWNGIKSFSASEKQPSFILVTKGKKTVFKINQ